MLSTLAFYLPQFHRVPENDKWWGEGFTEWTAVKAAEKLYKGHNQPRIPLHENYYDLMDYNTMAWQAGLMKKYRIDGMCMYHYWFENGRRILEKPAENLLRWTDIDMPFCFCWANVTWSRTWNKFSDSSVWSSKFETDKNLGDKGILLKQSYGREDQWEEHFQYLLPFFKDKRYLKIKNKPIFVILVPENILSLWSMVYYFNTRARENGFSGIYMIGIGNNKLLGMDAMCIKQADYALKEYIMNYEYSVRCSRTCFYDVIWELILKQKLTENKTYLCGLVDFDNTPRMGEETGYIMEGASPEKFYRYFKILYKKSLLLDNEFIFINAWNEWGEGMYLEPDEKHGYGYLEAIRRTVTECQNEDIIIDRTYIDNLYETVSDKKDRLRNVEIDNLKRHDKLLNNWLILKERKINFSKFFYKYGYKKIAIYGMGKLGMHLLRELEETNIQVLFGIDKDFKNNQNNIKIFMPDQNMPKVDAVVITIIGGYGKIGEMLSRNMTCSIVGIEEIIEEFMTDVI